MDEFYESLSHCDALRIVATSGDPEKPFFFKVKESTPIGKLMRAFFDITQKRSHHDGVPASVLGSSWETYDMLKFFFEGVRITHEEMTCAEASSVVHHLHSFLQSHP
jgi:hypothetical protein